MEQRLSLGGDFSIGCNNFNIRYHNFDRWCHNFNIEDHLQYHNFDIGYLNFIKIFAYDVLILSKPTLGEFLTTRYHNFNQEYHNLDRGCHKIDKKIWILRCFTYTVSWY